MRKREQTHKGKKWVRVLHLGDLGGWDLSEYNITGKYMGNIMQARLEVFSGLWSAAKTVVSWFAKGTLPEEYLSHNFDEHYLEDTRLICCLSYPSGGAPLIPGRYVSW